MKTSFEKNYSVPPIVYLAIIIIVFIFAKAEVQTVESCVSGDPAGFIKGFLNGMTLLISFIVSLFDDSVTIFNVNNNGGWYNFGFVFGVSLYFFIKRK